jgi:hypothetical protein
MKTSRARSRLVDVESTRSPLLRRPSPGVTLWQPEIVLACAVRPEPPAAPVILADPSLRPEAVHTHLRSTRAVLESLAAARHALGAQAAAARARGEQATSTRERVAAAMETYRAEARLDDVLTGALRDVRMLMEERGLR